MEGRPVASGGPFIGHLAPVDGPAGVYLYMCRWLPAGRVIDPVCCLIGGTGHLMQGVEAGSRLVTLCRVRHC